MSEFTKGPWHKLMWQDMGRPRVTILAEDRRPIFHMDGGMLRRDISGECFKTACLAEASPDMYEALEELIKCHIALTKHVGHDAENAVCLVKAKAALAKARGE